MRIIFSVGALFLMTQAALAQRHESRSRDRDRSTYAPASVNHSDTGDFTQDYSIFQDLNIFVRERHARVSNRGSNTPPRTPEQTFVLTGIVQDDNETYHANFENLSGGNLVKTSVGDPLARGKISAIEKDQIAYESNGSQTWVQIGNNLTGTSGGMTDSSSGGGPPVDPNAPGLTVEQRMKARRALQMNGGGGAPPPANTPQQPSSLATPQNVPQLNGQAGSGYGGRPQDPTFTPGSSVRVDQNDSAQAGAEGSAAAPPGVTPQNSNAANDPSEPVINHNFPPLPGEAPPAPPGN